MMDEVSAEASAAGAAPGEASGRLASLDVFRGATIAAMLLVNNQGDWDHVFGPLGHAKWHGCTFTDLIFPFFLFIVGVAIVFSSARQEQKQLSSSQRLSHIVRRTVTIFALGFLLNLIAYFAAPWVEYLRVMGVLQRIALCYFAAALIVLWQRPAAWVVWMAVILAGYWLLMTQVTAPGMQAGDLSREGNLAAYVDTHVFGRHNYKWDAETQMGHEPEGLLSTLPAIATTLSGCVAGWWLRRRNAAGAAKAAGLVIGGAIAVGLGLLWAVPFPLNKQIWTSSYVAFTSGWALITLGVCYWIVDVIRIRWWTKPFVVYGMNPITAYVGAGLLAYLTIWVKIPQQDGKEPLLLKSWIYERLYASWMEPAFGPYVTSAAYGFTYVIIFCALMWVLHSKRIFLKA